MTHFAPARIAVTWITRRISPSKNLVSLTYPDVSFTGEYTILDDGGTHEFNSTTNNGTPYQYVVRYKNTPHLEFDNNLRFFSAETDASLNCSESFVYYDGVKLPLVQRTEGGFDYCNIDIDGKLSREQLRDYTAGEGVYFAFNYLVEERTDFRILFDTSDRVEPKDDIEDYQYFLNSTTLDAGGIDDFFIKFTLVVTDVNDRPENASCKDWSTIISELYLGPDDADASILEDCTLEFFEGFTPPAAPETGESVTLEYVLPQNLYERCAETVTSNGESIVFSSTLNFPTRNEDRTCFYFQPGFSEQPVTITIDADVTESITDTVSQYSLELLSVKPKRAEPIEDYVVPQATLLFIFRSTFTGEALEFVESSVPYVGQEAMETSCSVDTRTCLTIRYSIAPPLTKDCPHSSPNATTTSRRRRPRRSSQLWTTMATMCVLSSSTRRDMCTTSSSGRMWVTDTTLLDVHHALTRIWNSRHSPPISVLLRMKQISST